MAYPWSGVPVPAAEGTRVVGAGPCGGAGCRAPAQAPLVREPSRPRTSAVTAYRRVGEGRGNMAELRPGKVRKLY